ncbi:MAG: hypothetical protein LBB73_07340 [Dysgonamonadaceae bacterium]|nr:hypothetical protein [Dysgonamonadaceae bacterium]
MKIYHRYRQPANRRRTVNFRRQGNNRCETREILLGNAAFVPGPTAICNICRRHGQNRLHRVQKQERRKIINLSSM